MTTKILHSNKINTKITGKNAINKEGPQEENAIPNLCLSPFNF
jgi:hypothetical protein